jgi:hypothetical protein
MYRTGDGIEINFCLVVSKAPIDFPVKCNVFRFERLAMSTPRAVELNQSRAILSSQEVRLDVSLLVIL